MNRLKFFEGSWEEALVVAKNENKPIFLEIRHLKPSDLLGFGQSGIEMLKKQGGYCQEL